MKKREGWRAKSWEEQEKALSQAQKAKKRQKQECDWPSTMAFAVFREVRRMTTKGEIEMGKVAYIREGGHGE